MNQLNTKEELAKLNKKVAVSDADLQRFDDLKPERGKAANDEERDLFDELMQRGGRVPKN